jgi:hypothetical protein
LAQKGHADIGAWLQKLEEKMRGFKAPEEEFA